MREVDLLSGFESGIPNLNPGDLSEHSFEPRQLCFSEGRNYFPEIDARGTWTLDRAAGSFFASHPALAGGFDGLSDPSLLAEATAAATGIVSGGRELKPRNRVSVTGLQTAGHLETAQCEVGRLQVGLERTSERVQMLHGWPPRCVHRDLNLVATSWTPSP